MGLLISWITLAFGLWLIAQILPGFEVKGFGGAMLVGLIFGIIHWAIGWLLFVAIGFGTLGIGFLLAFLTRWVVTALVLKLTDALMTSLTIKNFRTAFVGAILLSLLSLLRDVIMG